VCANESWTGTLDCEGSACLPASSGLPCRPRSSQMPPFCGFRTRSASLAALMLSSGPWTPRLHASITNIPTANSCLDFEATVVAYLSGGEPAYSTLLSRSYRTSRQVNFGFAQMIHAFIASLAPAMYDSMPLIPAGNSRRFMKHIRVVPWQSSEK
jgi:hypothetical protein